MRELCVKSGRTAQRLSSKICPRRTNSSSREGSNASSESSYLEAPIQRLGNIDVAPGRQLGSGATGMKAFGTCQFSACETWKPASVEDLSNRKVSLDFAPWQG